MPIDPSLPFLKMNSRPPKPRTRGITEIRGPYYSVLGRRQLEDLLEVAGEYADSLKFAGGSFALIPRAKLREIIEICHAFEVKVSTGGFIENVLRQGDEAVRKYVAACADLGFDTIEISAGFVSLSTEDWLRLIDLVQKAGLTPKPEIGVLFGAGGGSVEDPNAIHPGPEWAIARAHRFIEAGVDLLMVESEGVTENVAHWRTEVPARLVEELGLAHLMFEAADPHVFDWYVRTYGPDVNLFVDHSQILQLECLRTGIWGEKESWGRITSFGEDVGMRASEESDGESPARPKAHRGRKVPPRPERHAKSDVSRH